MIGDINYKTSQVSSFQPPESVALLTNWIKKEYGYGNEILNKSWEELNFYSVIDRASKDQRTFNSFVDESVDDPNEAWKWKGTRSMAANRAMTMHAHLTSNFVVPSSFAQNENQDEDREASEIMDTVLEWMTINSGYRQAFLLSSMGMLVNPVTYLGAEYQEVYQKIKEKTDRGYKKVEILDEVLSGFQTPIYTADQILITNAYEQNIQKQRAILKRKYVEMSELEAKYGDHPNWQFVTPGIKSVYSEDNGLFYNVFDPEHPYLVEETTFLSRRDDTEVCLINGIYFGDDNVEWNPIRHRDNRNAPKYNVVPFGYHRINEHFFYFKSLMNKVGWDNTLLDALYEVEMNTAFLDMLPPTAFYGVDKVDTQINFPGAQAVMMNPNAKAESIFPPRNRSAGILARQAVEASLTEASINETQAGQLPESSQKAYTVARAEQNAKTILKGAGRNLAEAIGQYGCLMIDVALQHLTAPELDEITGATKYRPFTLKDQLVNGKKVSKKIIFDESLMNPMSDKENETAHLKLLSEVGYPDNKEAIYRVNPHLWSKLKYLIRIDADTLQEKNKALEQALASQLYTMTRKDPLVNPKQLLLDLFKSFGKDAGDFVLDQSQINQVMGGQGTETPQTSFGSQFEQKQVAGALSEVPAMT